MIYWSFTHLHTFSHVNKSFWWFEMEGSRFNSHTIGDQQIKIYMDGCLDLLNCGDSESYYDKLENS